MIELIKERCGIAATITVYDDDIQSYIDDCKEDMTLAGVNEELINAEIPGVITAVTLYVKANLGNDRSDTEKYMELYHKKLFRLTLMEPEVAPVQPEEGENDVE